MKKGLYQDFEREWRKWKRLRFFYFVLPVFLTMLSVRIIQVYFHLKMEQLKNGVSLPPGRGRRREKKRTAGADRPAGSAAAGACLLSESRYGVVHSPAGAGKDR